MSPVTKIPRALAAAAAAAAAAAGVACLAALPTWTSAAAASHPRLVSAGANVQSDFAGYGYQVQGAHASAVTSVSTSFRLMSAAERPATGEVTVEPVAELFKPPPPGNSAGGTGAAGGFYETCSDGKLSFWNVLQVDSHYAVTSLAVGAGDEVSVSVTQDTAGAKVVVSDLTRGKSRTYTGANGSWAGDDTNAMVGYQGSTAPQLDWLVRSGTTTFSNDLADGVAIGSLPHTGYNFVYSTQTGTWKLGISTGHLDAAGTSFQTTFAGA